MQFIKKNRHFVIALALCIVYIILNYAFSLPFYWLLIALFVYALIAVLVSLPNAAGMTGFLLYSMTKRFEPYEGLMSWGFDRGCNNPATLAGYGLELTKRFRFERALEAYKRLLEQPDIPPMILKTARQNYSLTQWKCGDIDGAIATMEQMLVDYEYFSADFFTTLGFYYLEKKEYEKAVETTKKALEYDSGNAAAFDNLGQIAYRQGLFDEARAQFAEALEHSMTLPDSKYYLGCIAEAEGDPEAAAVFFRAAAKNKINGFNTITPEMLQEKLSQYC